MGLASGSASEWFANVWASFCCAQKGIFEWYTSRMHCIWKSVCVAVFAYLFVYECYSGVECCSVWPAYHSRSEPTADENRARNNVAHKHCTVCMCVCMQYVYGMAAHMRVNMMCVFVVDVDFFHLSQVNWVFKQRGAIVRRAVCDSFASSACGGRADGMVRSRVLCFFRYIGVNGRAYWFICQHYHCGRKDDDFGVGLVCVCFVYGIWWCLFKNLINSKMP